jgi:hypothetical protein
VVPNKKNWNDALVEARYFLVEPLVELLEERITQRDCNRKSEKQRHIQHLETNHTFLKQENARLRSKIAALKEQLNKPNQNPWQDHQITNHPRWTLSEGWSDYHQKPIPLPSW